MRSKLLALMLAIAMAECDSSTMSSGSSVESGSAELSRTWTATTFVLPAPASRFAVNGTIAIRYKTTSSHDASDVGQMALCANSGAGCTPGCSSKICGPDGCGGSCGTCGAGTTTCNTSGQCVSSGGGGVRWVPPKALTWYWQLSGNVNMTRNVAAYDIDGFDNAATTVATLHGQGKKAICYFSAGTYEDWRPDASLFPGAALGRGNGWPGEKWLDIRNATVKTIMRVRMQMCKDKGFDAIEPDNIDGYTNLTGFPLTAQGQLNYNSWIANTAHSLGLAAFLKNDVDQISSLQPYFDGALNEQCAEYRECGGYSAFLNANKPVLQAEYSGGTSFCADATAAERMAALFDLDLTGSTFIPCW